MRAMVSSVDIEFLTVAEAASFLRVDRSTVRRWIENGTLPAYRVGQRRVRIDRRDLERVISSTSPKPSKKPPVGIRYVESDEELQRKLTDDEIKEALAAVAAARELREELLRKRGGVPFPSSWQLIREMRDERTEQLP
jgi:excisionase family DNA binding protein